VSLEKISPTVKENYGCGEMILSAAGFAKANPGIVSLMLKDLENHCPRVGNTLELYGGSGTFSLLLGAISRRVTVYEGNRTAAVRGRENAARNGRENIRVVNAPSEKAKFPVAVDLVFVDPPRSGLSPLVRQKILASGASQVIYVSCDPATLARDLATFVQAPEGFRVQRLMAYDMYPGTTHLETVAYLFR
jgi:tRNA/tmRNA/rRNA uracil-C5-methylase (TrmA/RlmC/RlmD family)